MMREKTMIAPVRLIEGGGDALERELLHAARREPVPGASRARVAQALGVSALLSAGGGGSGLGAAGNSASSGSAAAAGAQSGVRVGMLGKSALLAVLGGLATFAGVGSWSAPPPASRAQGVVSPAAPALRLAPVPDQEPSFAVTKPASSPDSVTARDRAAPQKKGSAPRRSNSVTGHRG